MAQASNGCDVELGLAQKNGVHVADDKTSSFVYQPLAPPQEPYLSLEDIMELHGQTRIDGANIERSLGLTEAEAARRLQLYGRNVLTPPARTPEWQRFLLQFTNVFLLLLNGCAVLSIVAYVITADIINLYLAIVLLVVVCFTAFIQFHEEGKALAVIDSFAKMLAAECIVIRQGEEKKITTDLLVPGDLVKVQNGDRVPADLVLLLCRGLKAECSSLTGESEPVSCTHKTSAKSTPFFECKNVAFNTSLCFDGMALGVVFRTGDHTGIGTIAKLASDTKQRESTLQKEVRNFVRLVAVVSLTMASACFVGAVFVQQAKTVDAIIKLFVNGFLVIIVANVPQGLPATVTSLLSLAARNMAQRSVLVKRIDCVETLGSTSLICSDKTGTLTKNEMTVTDVCASRLVWRNAVSVSVLNFDAKLPTFVGNPSDVAIITYADALCSSKELRKMYPIVFEVPFNSTNKWQLILVKSVESVPEETDMVAYEVIMKGAPEVILKKCSSYASSKARTNQFKEDATEVFRQEFEDQYKAFASQGRRVLAMCSKTFLAPQDVVFGADENGVYNFLYQK
eukprot:CCRYP_021108-RA/>CCRYP_021108-RA protein AED:0.28 eAED:0.31 QI:0/0/0/1/1/1/3/0/567